MEKNLTSLEIDQSCIIKRLDTNNIDMENFLFTLGCYPGEPITLVSRISETYVIAIKDARYSIDKDFAQAIVID